MRPVGSVLEAVGAHTLADQADAAAFDGDVVSVAMPHLSGDVRARRLKMRRAQGHDQVAEALRRAGWHGFEPPMPTLVRYLLGRRRGLVFDVGANTGFYSLLAAIAGCTVYAFEPFPPAAELFEQNIALLGAGAGRIHPSRVAIGATAGEATLYVPHPSGQLVETSASLDPDFKGVHAQRITVPVTTLDQEWAALGRPAVEFVKIDVEGHERAVLDGASSMIGGARPILFIEVLKGAEELEAFRAQVGFVDVRLSVTEAVIGEAVRFDPESWNHLLCPPERLAEVHQAVRRAGLVLTTVG